MNMNILKFFIKKLPILSLVVIAGIILRCAGLVDSFVDHEGHDYLKSPVYTQVLDNAAKALGVGNAGTVTVTTASEKEAKEKTAEGNKPKAPSKDAAAAKASKKEATKAEQAEPQKPAGYESAEEQAKRTGKSLEEIKKSRDKKSNHTYVYADSFPPGASRPVVQAVDYGVADQRYMDEFGTKYDYIDKGIFAQDHDYYKFQRVEDDYFDNALFVGDSQSDGIYNYGLIRDHASFYALESVTAYNLFDVRIPFRSPTEEYDASLNEVLAKRDYGKIYICLGVNEMGVPDTILFRKAYIKVIKKIRKAQPAAIIYIQGIMHLSAGYSTSDPAFNNKNVVQRNEAISKLANGHDIFYIDPNEAVCDGNGDLRADYTNDGIHLTAQYYPIWHEYLNNFAIVRGRKDK